MFPLHHESCVALNASIETAFAYLDDFGKLSAHMEKPSGMMMGSRMTIETDERGGRAVGSRVRMVGKMMGIRLSLVEIVTERNAPLAKTWQTVDANLVVIAQYQLGFELIPTGTTCLARVFIDYALPEKAPARWLGGMFARMYARWCTGRMAADAQQYFATQGARAEPRPLL